MLFGVSRYFHLEKFLIKIFFKCYSILFTKEKDQFYF